MAKRRKIEFDLPSFEELFKEDDSHEELWNLLLGGSKKTDESTEEEKCCPIK